MIEEKINGGKLIYIYFLESNDTQKIGKVKICGDFFLHPEEEIGRLQERIEIQKIDISEKELQKIIEEELEGVEVVGFSAQDLARLIKRGRFDEMENNRLHTK